MPLRNKIHQRLQIARLAARSKKKEMSVQAVPPQEIVAAEEIPPTIEPGSLGARTSLPIQGASEAQGLDAIIGRRIMNASHVFKEYSQILSHGPLDCGVSSIEFLSEVRNGLKSDFHFRCKMCNLPFLLSSEPREQDPQNDINFACVSGFMSIGAGFSQFQEVTGALNIPPMTKKTYASNHEKVANAWEKTALHAMKMAGDEERRLAIENGDVDKDGIARVTVVVDGAWSKRSYKTKYNAPSGVGAICGYKTKKVLYYGVRNKCCSICKKAEKSKKQAPQHRCYKNWNGSSTAMEADIILEGFRKSEDMHKLRYTQYIGDGDSSVRNVINIAKPYGNRTITKIQCRNHILRNYSNKLRKDLYDPKRHDKATRRLRYEVKCQERRLRSAVTGAINYRNQQQGSLSDKILNLRKDILNGPNHVFGDHSNCESYFCTPPKEGVSNSVPELKQKGVYDDLMNIVQQIADHAPSLIHNVDSNTVEHFNSIVCKFVGGKRINFSLRGSYAARCAGSVISHNSGKIHSTTQRAAFSRSPCLYTKKLETQREKGREAARKRRIEAREKSFASRRRPRRLCYNDPEADEHYGPLAEKSVSDDAEKKDAYLSSLKMSEDERNELEAKTREQSDSHDWFSERKKRLTASNFGEVCKMRASTDRSKLVERLLNGSRMTTTAMSLGKFNEKKAIEHLEEQILANVQKCGLVIDLKKSYLGASPDGLVGLDHVVEVKCPFLTDVVNGDYSIRSAVKRKKITYLSETKDGKLVLKENHSYMYQVQGQLHITERKYCYFVVWTPTDMLIEVIERDDDFWKTRMENKLDTFYMDHLLPALLKDE